MSLILLLNMLLLIKDKGWITSNCLIRKSKSICAQGSCVLFISEILEILVVINLKYTVYFQVQIRLSPLGNARQFLFQSYISKLQNAHKAVIVTQFFNKHNLK